MRVGDLKDDLPPPGVMIGLPPSELAGFVLRAINNQRERPALYKIVRALSNPPVHQIA